MMQESRLGPGILKAYLQKKAVFISYCLNYRVYKMRDIRISGSLLALVSQGFMQPYLFISAFMTAWPIGT